MKSTLSSYKDFVRKLPASNPCDIFSNLELSLHNLEVFGFDYDYTLAHYTEFLEHYIYKRALEYMLNDMRYPRGMKDFVYKPGFPIRGLHFDQRQGNLLKLDYFEHGTTRRRLSR